MSWLTDLLDHFRRKKPPQPPAAVPPPGDVLAQVNAARQTAGLPLLRADGRLDRMASDWATRMAANGWMRHQDLGNAARYGYYGLVGECVAEGPPGAVAVVALLLGDPTHRKILLGGQYSALGWGATQSGGGMFWCVDVGVI